MGKQRRTEDIDVVFGVPEGMAEGWVFGVPASFRDALDIKWMERRTNKVSRWVWTRGQPPAYGFAQGDAFYVPHTVRGAAWDQVAVEMAALVAEAEGMLDLEDNVGAGRVLFDLWRGRPGKVPCERHESTQTGFAMFLRTGLLDGCRRLS